MSDKLPDAGEAFRLYLISRPAVTAIVEQRVSVSLEGSGAAVRYTLAGGSMGWGEGSALIFVDCWGKANTPDDGTASNLARTVCAEIEQMRGVWGDAWVAGAFVEGWPADAPDPQSNRPRQQNTVRLELYPKENVA